MRHIKSYASSVLREFTAGANTGTIALCIALLAFFLCNDYQTNDYYKIKWGAFVIGSTLFVGYQLWKHTSQYFAMLYTYLMLSAGMASLWKVGPYAIARKSLLFELLLTWVFLASAAIIICYAPHRKLFVAIKWLVPVNMLFTLYCLLDGQKYPHGFDYNVSLNGTLMAMMLPFWCNWFSILCTLALCAASKTSMGMFATLAVAFAYYFAKCPNKYRLWYILFWALIGYWVLFLMSSIYGANLWDFSGRLGTWWAIPKLVAREGREWFGFGAGSCSHILPGVKMLVPDITPDDFMMLWVHNDYLQFYFESGIYGIILAIPVAIEMIYKAWHKPIFLSFIAAYLASCVGNFPSHLASTSLLLVVMIALIYRKGELNETC